MILCVRFISALRAAVMSKLFGNTTVRLIVLKPLLWDLRVFMHSVSQTLLSMLATWMWILLWIEYLMSLTVSVCLIKVYTFSSDCLTSFHAFLYLAQYVLTVTLTLNSLWLEIMTRTYVTRLLTYDQYFIWLLTNVISMVTYVWVVRVNIAFTFKYFRAVESDD